MASFIHIEDGKLIHCVLSSHNGPTVFKIPECVREICEGAFNIWFLDDNLQALMEEYEYESDNWDCFCHIETIEIGKNVEKIQQAAFCNIPNLRTFIVDKDCKCACVKDDMLFSYDMKTLICVPPSKTGDVICIPQGVTIIGDNAFEGNYYYSNAHHRKVIIPESVIRIDNDAFYTGDIDEILIPGTNIQFGERVFKDYDGVVVTPVGSKAWEYAVANNVKTKGMEI